jgi:hypothetical protein
MWEIWTFRYFGPIKSPYRAHTPIEGLVAIIARNRIIRLAFVTPRCFRRPEDDKGSPRGISSERFAASAGRGGGVRVTVPFLALSMATFSK